MLNTDIVPDERTRPTVGVRDAARMLGIADSTAYLAAKTGDIPTIRVGGRILVPTAALRRLLGLPLAADESAAA